MAKLQPAFKQDGPVTEGIASTINDGAAALVLMHADEVARTDFRHWRVSRPGRRRALIRR